MRRFLCSWFAVLFCFASLASAEDSPATKTVAGGWTIWRSEHFRVCTQKAGLELEGLAERCEDVKGQLNAQWFAGEETASWKEPCDVIVHGTLADYQAALGNEVGNSVGCCTLKYDRGKVVNRRLDIRADADNWKIDALPHELTHLLVSDHIGNSLLPLWLDEGIGVLSESTAKRRFRATTFEESHRRGSALPSSTLVRLRTLPGAKHNDAFYTQSAALVRLLMERGESEDFIRFVKQTSEHGVERALHDCYGIADLAELGRLAQKSDVGQLVRGGGTLRDLLVMSGSQR
jgi:hypothetical protein